MRPHHAEIVIKLRLRLVDKRSRIAPEAPRHVGKVDTFRQSQPHQQGFARLFGPFERASFGDPVPLCGYRGEVVFGLAVAHGCRFAPATVGSGADAEIVLVAPVGEVVAAFLPGCGVVADLVGGQAGGRGHRAGQREEIGGIIIIERLEHALADIGGKPGRGLDGELVERHMRRPQR